MTADNLPDSANNATTQSTLTHKSTLLKSGGINLLTKIIPLIVGFVTVPVMMHGFGVERFGILSIVWAIVGYATVFDVGIGRALTQLVSRRLGEGEQAQLPATILTALLLAMAIGTLAALLLVLLGSPLVAVLHVSPSLESEARLAVLWLACSLPFLIGNIALMGVLESFQRFGLINLLRLPIVFCNFIAPVLLLPYTQSLADMVAVIALGRVVLFGLLLACMPRLLGGFYRRAAIRWTDIPSLIHFGKWVTVSNVIGPLTLYFDRFLISYLLSAKMVAYYTTPYDLLSRAKTLPESALNVLFPAFSAELVRDPERARRMYRKSMGLMILATLPPALIGVWLSHWGLTLWLGPAFAAKSTLVTQVLIGVMAIWLNAQLNVTLIQAAGRADLTAKWLLVQLPLYLPVLWWSISTFGLPGAAMSLLLKQFLDWGVSFWMGERVMNRALTDAQRVALDERVSPVLTRAVEETATVAAKLG